MDHPVMKPVTPEYAAATYLPNPPAERRGVALCLSGGGFRAALFHLGAVRRLNECGVLSRVDTISSVSGGSILSAHLARRVRPWPVAGSVFPDWEARVVAPFYNFTGKNLRTWLPLLGLLQQLLWVDVTRGAATGILAKRYEQRLTSQRFSDLPARPRFVFCATDIEFGVNWVFDSGAGGHGGRFGDYEAGYVHPAPPWPLGRVVAASSCFPPFFNPVPSGLDPAHLGGGSYSGTDRQPLVRGIRLADGGVYDNLGLEPVWKDHLVVMVSDGGGLFKPGRDSGLLWRLQRYVGIMGHQDLALRKRWLISSLIAGQIQGAYWGIGSAASHYSVGAPGYSPELAQDVISEIRTDLDAFSPAECAVLENHGYLVAEAAIRAHLLPAFGIMTLPPLRIPHPKWLDEQMVRYALAGSARSIICGRSGGG